MSKFSKIIVILIISLLVVLNINLSYATEENSDITSISEDVQVVEDASEQITSSLNTLSTSSVTKVSTINSYEQANLQLNNILSIILISIGVLLILFAIAILIRLKK